MTFSTITVSGTVSKEAEQRYTPNNTSVVSFMMNILRYDNRSKEEKSYPIKINLWGDNHSDKVPNLQVGARVIVSGRLQLDQFSDRNGKNVRLVVIEANTIHFANELSKTPSGVSANTELSDSIEQSYASPNYSASEEEIPF